MKTRSFFSFMGVDDITLSKCPSAEQTKYRVLVALIFVPVFTGTIGAWFVGAYLTHSVLVQIGVAVFWGTIVFVVERALIMATLKSSSRGLEYWLRWLLAVSMGYVISTMILVVVFAGRINIELSKDSNSRRAEIESVWKRQEDEAYSRLMEYKNRCDSIERAVNQEIDGKEGSGIGGDGPSAASKRNALNRACEEYEKQKVAYDNRIQEYMDEKNDALSASRYIQDNSDLLARIEALNRICVSSGAAMFFRITLSIVFVLMETLGMIIAHKIGGEGGSYHDIAKFEDVEVLGTARAKAEHDLKINQLRYQTESEIEFEKILSEKELKSLQVIIRQLQARMDALLEVSHIVDANITLSEGIFNKDYRDRTVKKIKLMCDDGMEKICESGKSHSSDDEEL